MKNKKIVLLIIFSLLLPINFTLGVQTYEDNPDFNANYLIADEDMLDYTSMTIEQIRDFAQEKGGTLDTYIDPQNGMMAYWVIWHTAQEFRISPKFLLTLLQKEQSLVTDDEPTENQYNWATGYSCYGGVCLDKYRGFTEQVRAAAKKFKEYMDDLSILGKYESHFYCTFTKWCVGALKMTQDSVEVRPQTKATAALYTYNPYRGNTVVDGYRIGANYNFWKIWENWFETSSFRPNGTLLKSPVSDDVYLIKDNIKRRFTSFTALITRYDPRNIIIVSQEELDEFVEGPEIKFAQYSLLMDPDENIFLLVDDKLRHIVSQEVFRTLGFNPEEYIEVTHEDLIGFEEGEDLTLESSYPTGALIREVETSGVYYVKNGIKYPIYSPEILQINYPNQIILSAHTDELEQYPKGAPVKFAEGTLIKAENDGRVYVVSDGQRLHIKNEASFISRGYQWTNIIETNEQAVNVHPSGPALEALASSTPALEIIDDESSELE